MEKIFLTGEWRKLILVNYVIDQEVLLPLLPYGTTLDLWEGKCYVSLVGFRFINTKLKGIYIPFHRNFEEINLRFYVRHKDGESWKRGVVFIKEIVPKPALALVARMIYGEPYVFLPTGYNWNTANDLVNVVYKWKHDRSWDEIKVSAQKNPVALTQGSKEQFITEHYWGYTRLREKLTSQYQVDHPAWKMYHVEKSEINVRFEKLYGSKFKMLDHMVPDSVMLAEGSAITVRSATKIKGTAG
jgi:uncharacterized protein YqjF (DUF2071 family)